MNQIEQNCWDRWASLKNTVQLIKLKRGAGMDTEKDRAHATQILEELRLYHDADLMPHEMRSEYQGQVGGKLKTLLS